MALAPALYDPPATEDDQRDGPPKRTPAQIAQYWLDAIQSAEKKRKPYITRGKQIIKRFKNKRTLTTLGVPVATRRMNVLWSNVQTQKPVLYSQTPKANVSRRNKAKDPIGRTAAIVLQNCLQNSLGMEDFDYVMGQVVEDRLLPGCGEAMVEYVPEVAEDQVGWQAAETRYLNWQDFLTNVARTWQEVTWFAYKVYLTRRECYDVALTNSKTDENPEGDKAFADDVWREITLDHKEDKKADGSEMRDDTAPAKATVWCIWDKTSGNVIQISPGYPKAPLGVMPPPVKFDGFFPIPRPLQSTTSNDSTIPVPDFEQYVDQADEIDLLTQRIGILTKALKVRGLYPADMDSLKLLADSGDADMIPYDQFQLIQERGGAEGLIVWFPVETIAKTLVQCIELRQNALEIMYEITGISDIRRGQTEASETATAQQLKAQYGAVRIRDSQRDVQRFIRDLLRLKAEIICEQFSLEVIKAMAGVKLLSEKEKQLVQRAAQIWDQFGQMAAQAQQEGVQPPPQPPVPQPSPEMIEALEEPSWDQVMGILRNEKLRGFIVDVETDSTIEPDQQAAQQSASGFVEAVTAFMTAALPIVQAEPQAADMMGEMLSWAANQWKGADTIVGSIDEFVDKVKKKAEEAEKNPPPPPPEVQAEQIKAQAEGQKAQADVAMVQLKANTEAQQAQMDMQAKFAEFQMEMTKLRAEIEALAQQNQLKAEDMVRSQEAAEHGHELKLETMDAQARARQEAAETGGADA